eukprot:tig00021108_g18307.t1
MGQRAAGLALGAVSALASGNPLAAAAAAIGVGGPRPLVDEAVTQRWVQGALSNFEYLMYINTVAGRTYNDLTQYPVFPWVLADYASQELDLEDPASFRDLSKPMGALDAGRLAVYEERFLEWDPAANAVEVLARPDGSSGDVVRLEVPAFHYGSHYSSAGIVLYYLIRLQPYAWQARRLQGGRWDHPDRLFDAVDETWASASRLNLSDVKELTPEWFYLPEFLENRARLPLGRKQSGADVADVRLPPWARGDARLFVRRHRQALESRHVSERLHEWIELVFGHRQQGKGALAARNLFHPFTYEGAVDIDAIADPVLRAATVAQIHNFGQAPRQLFFREHPPRRPAPAPGPVGFFTHPELLTGSHKGDVADPPVASITFDAAASALIATGRRKAIVRGAGPDARYVSWGEADGAVRLRALDSDRPVAVLQALHDRPVSCVAVSEDGRLLVTGGEDTVVNLWRLPGPSGSARASPPPLQQPRGRRGGRGERRRAGAREREAELLARLCSHYARVTCAAISVAWSVVVSGSEDRTAILWDLNRLRYVRQLRRHAGPVACVAVDEASGNVVTTCGPTVLVWSINGDCLVRHEAGAGPAESVTALALSRAPEWLDCNVVITGHRDGAIRMWSVAFDGARGARAGPRYTLRLRSGEWKASSRDPAAPASHAAAITAFHVSQDQTKLWSGDEGGRIVCWALPDAPVVKHFEKAEFGDACNACGRKFGLALLERRHHCRSCGRLFCDACSSRRTEVVELGYLTPARHRYPPPAAPVAPPAPAEPAGSARGGLSEDQPEEAPPPVSSGSPTGAVSSSIL